jgi:hypothetical protein
MSNCCLKNLGCLQIPVSTISQAGQAGATGATGAPGAPGDPGAPGATGADGTTRLYSLTTPASTATTGSATATATYTLLANELATNGSSVMVRATIAKVTNSVAIPPLTAPYVAIEFDGVSASVLSSFEPNLPVTVALIAGETYYFNVEMIRTSATALKCRVSHNLTQSNEVKTYEVSITSQDLTINNDITFVVYQNVASQISLSTFTIDKITQ